jgi:hypothetical protein
LNAAIVRFEETVAAAIAAQLLDSLASDLPARLLIELQLLGANMHSASWGQYALCAVPARARGASVRRGVTVVPFASSLCDCSITTSECCALSFDNHQALKINRA